jgi:hypothetical protein
MWMQINAAVVSAALLAGAAGIACAQGSSTQDPGSLTPGNLTFQNLGPAGPAPGPAEGGQTTRLPGAYGSSGTAGTVIGPGTNSTGFGAGNTSGFRGNAAGSGR